MPERHADPEIKELQATWPGWCIWRGRRGSDTDNARTGAWIASRTDPDAGVYPTVIEDNRAQLDTTLTHQATLAQAVRDLAAAFEGRKVHTEPVGPGLRVTHLVSGRCETVAVRFDQMRGGLSWAWLDNGERIGDADQAAAVAAAIADRLSRLRRPVPEPEGVGIWGDG